MSATLLTETRGRKAAHGRHRCGYCHRSIARGELYLDQRIADDRTVYTFRGHLACDSAYWSWKPGEEHYDLVDLTGGHLPPCSLAWDKPTLESCTCAAGEPTPEAEG